MSPGEGVLGGWSLVQVVIKGMLARMSCHHGRVLYIFLVGPLSVVPLWQEPWEPPAPRLRHDVFLKIH